MNIEEYGFERSDLVVVTAVNAYLKNLTPEARRETLGEIVKQGGVIDGPALADLIENAKAAAMISSEEWQLGEGDYHEGEGHAKANCIQRQRFEGADCHRSGLGDV